MSIQYKTIGIAKPGVVGGGEVKFYATIDRGKRIRFPDIIDEISELNVTHRGAVMAVMEMFISRINYHISHGRGIELGSIGTFYPTITSLPSEVESDVTTSNIKKLRVIFRPSPRLRDRLKQVKFEKSVYGTAKSDQA